MKKIIAGLSIFICTVSVAQVCDSVNIGTKTLYTAPSKKPTPVPAGYSPVFINHVGRHGARHLTKNVDASKAWQFLMAADSANMLTSNGIHLKKLLQQLQVVEQKNIKSISAQGVQEQQGIAERMYRQNESFFKQNNITCTVQITKEIRTKQTADAFLHQLTALSPFKDNMPYQVNDTILRSYDLSPAYLRFEESGSWKAALQTARQQWMKNDVAGNMFTRFFKKDFLTRADKAATDDFVADLYGFFTILPSIQNETGAAGIQLTADSIRQFFTCNELLAIGKTDRVEDYLVKGPGLNNKGIQVKIAAPLLVDFINTTDSFIQREQPALRLRFSHAETIAPFAALLGITGADKAVKNAALFNDRIWDASAVVPLSANVQWILYKKSGTADYLVKFLLNEKEVAITGLPTIGFPYYSWKAVRQFYMNKLQLLHLQLTDRLFLYLQYVR